MGHEIQTPLDRGGDVQYSSVGEQQVPQLSVVVPTFNEAENVPLLVARLTIALREIPWEVVFVDDNSPDGTAATARRLAQKDQRIRCLRRIGRRGLAGACIEGILASSALNVAVMDGDLQHDERQLTRMEQIWSWAHAFAPAATLREASPECGNCAARLPQQQLSACSACN